MNVLRRRIDCSAVIQGMALLEEELPVENALKKKTDVLPETLGEHHIVVGIGEEAIPKLGSIPHHTVALKWSLDPGEPTELLYKELASKISDLMAILTGEGST